MTNWRFDWRSCLIGVGAVFLVIIVAALMVNFGIEPDPQHEPMAWTGAENVTDEGESPGIEFQVMSYGELWHCVCPSPSSFVYISGINTGTAYVPESTELLTFIAGGEEIVRCTPMEDEMPDVTFKVHDPNNFCFYHDHEIESRVYVGLEEYGPICEEAAEELSGPLVLEEADE